MKIVCVVGTRPNFIKIGALYNEFNKRKNIYPLLVHTGQHYDHNMSAVFFDELGLPKPDINLEVGSGTNTFQTAQIMLMFEPILKEFLPDLVIVVGDVNSTLAAAFVTANVHIPLAHVEAGLRSGDRKMPEEINRIIVDHLADFLFVTEQSGLNNLKKEGISDEKIFFVGNVMVDSLLNNIQKAENSTILKSLGVSKNEYILVTLHRPSNADDEANLKNILMALMEINHNKTVVLPIHPRTKKMIQNFGMNHLLENKPGFIITHPLGYLDFLNAMKNAYAVITDSGGIQEETTVLGVRCLTIRNNTERPITIECGTNTLVGTEKAKIIQGFNAVSTKTEKHYQRPPFWDGKAAERIVDILTKNIS